MIMKRQQHFIKKKNAFNFNVVKFTVALRQLRGQMRFSVFKQGYVRLGCTKSALSPFLTYFPFVSGLALHAFTDDFTCPVRNGLKCSLVKS